MTDGVATARFPGRAWPLLAVSVSLVICGGLLIYGAGRGLDLTDEVFYLVWTRDPNAYALIYQPFGYLLHPLFELVGGDLRLFRLSGCAIAAVSGAFLGFTLAPRRSERRLFALHGAVAALTIFFPWIITPSYNSAANVGAILIIIALLQGWAQRPVPVVIAGGAGLCIAAFAKPPLFAIAVTIMLVATAATGRLRTGLAFIAALLLDVALASLLLSPADVPGLLRRMAYTQHLLALPNTPLGLPLKMLRDGLVVPPLLLGGSITATLGFVCWRSPWATWLGYAAVALSLCYVIAIAQDAIDGEIPEFIGYALILVAMGYAVVLRGRWSVTPAALALLLGAPAAVALGTFNNQWSQLNFSMCFPFLALFVLADADPHAWRRSAFHGLAVAGPAVVLLVAAFDPYSLPAPIFAQQVPVEHPVTHSRILVDQETADFVRSAAGRGKGQLVVDLSGTGPGVAAELGARAPVLSWLNPATPTWPDVVWSRLDAQDRQQAIFVGPVWPLFARTAPARWLAGHQASYCREMLPEMPFWGTEKRLAVWRPCPADTGSLKPVTHFRSKISPSFGHLFQAS